MLFPLYRGGSLADLGERLAAEGRSLATAEALHLFLQASAPQCRTHNLGYKTQTCTLQPPEGADVARPVGPGGRAGICAPALRAVGWRRSIRVASESQVVGFP